MSASPTKLLLTAIKRSIVMAKERALWAMEMGARIAERRKQLGWTQEQAAEASGLSWQFFACVERGIKNIRAESLLNLSRSMNVSADYLLTGKQSGVNYGYLSKYMEPLSEMQLKYLEEILKNYLLACGHSLPD